jgi:hypothetical protein
MVGRPLHVRLDLAPCAALLDGVVADRRLKDAGSIDPGFQTACQAVR